jgi:hypothetical protein
MAVLLPAGGRSGTGLCFKFRVGILGGPADAVLEGNGEPGGRAGRFGPLAAGWGGAVPVAGPLTSSSSTPAWDVVAWA